MPSLNELIGQTIVALVPIFDPKIFKQFKLHAVETGGIWIENQEVTNTILGAAKRSAAPKTLIFFLPYQQISFVIGSLDVPSLSDQALT